MTNQMLQPRVEYYPPGHLPIFTRPGQIVFTMRRAPINYAIWWFQSRRYPRDLSWATHCEVVINEEGDTAGAVWPKVRGTNISEYRGWSFVLVTPRASVWEMEALAEYAESHLGESYSLPELAGAGYYLLSGRKPPVALDYPDQTICSGLVSAGLHELSAYPMIHLPHRFNSPAYLLSDEVLDVRTLPGWRAVVAG